MPASAPTAVRPWPAWSAGCRAPEGSGVPVGTEYHWYVLAHQNVLTLNANDYTTSLAGLKFKIAHRRAETGKWSATPRTQRKRMIEDHTGDRPGSGRPARAPARGLIHDRGSRAAGSATLYAPAG